MKWMIRFLLTFLLFTAWIGLGFVYVDHSLSTPHRANNVTVEIPKGSTISDIGQLLEKHQLIRDDSLFTTYVKIKGNSKTLQAGVYQIPPSMDVEEMLHLFAQGKQHTFTLTVPEGYTTEQIGAEIERKSKLKKIDFIRAVDDKRYRYRYSFVSTVLDKKERKHRLEGYLFPSTYQIPKNATATEIVDLMLHQFDQRLEQDEFSKKLKERKLDMDKWVTIASLVEREGQAKEEFPRIAGVIYNRLQEDMKLQIDATIQYARGKQKEKLSYKDLELSSPYNTYQVKGLPPSAIANPGKEALEAALQPEEHEYLYYVTKKDGSGTHYFAKSFQEHRHNIKKSKKVEESLEE